MLCPLSCSVLAPVSLKSAQLKPYSCFFPGKEILSGFDHSRNCKLSRNLRFYFVGEIKLRSRILEGSFRTCRFFWIFCLFLLLFFFEEGTVRNPQGILNDTLLRLFPSVITVKQSEPIFMFCPDMNLNFIYILPNLVLFSY